MQYADNLVQFVFNSIVENTIPFLLERMRRGSVLIITATDSSEKHRHQMAAYFIINGAAQRNYRYLNSMQWSSKFDIENFKTPQQVPCEMYNLKANRIFC